MLKGWTANKGTEVQSKSSYANFVKHTPNRYQSHQNNITFQNYPENEIIFSSKTDDLIYDALTINS